MKTNICPFCQKHTIENSNFCQFCGEPISEQGKELRRINIRKKQIDILSNLSEKLSDVYSLEIIKIFIEKLGN